jgi:hypothetical protein
MEIDWLIGGLGDLKIGGDRFFAGYFPLLNWKLRWQNFKL